MAVVTNAIVLPDGSAPSSVAVRVDLVASDAGSSTGWRVADDVAIESSSPVSVAADGTWSIELTPNDEIDPDGTVYRVTEIVEHLKYVHYISVGTSGGSVYELLVDAPVGPVLTYHASQLEAHGVVGSVVGTENAQILTNKTIVDPVVSASSSAAKAIRVAVSAERQARYDARDYGTAGTFTAVQAAIDAASAAGGGEVWLSAGNWDGQTSLSLEGTRYVAVRGTPGITRLRRTNGDGPVIKVSGEWAELSGVQLMYSHATFPPELTAVGMEITGSTRFCRFVDVYCFQVYDGLRCNSSTFYSNKFDTFRVSTFSGTGVHVATSGGGSTGNVWNNLYINNNAPPYSDLVRSPCFRAIHMEGVLGSVFNQVNIEYCNFALSDATSAIYMRKTPGIVFNSLYFEAPRLRGGQALMHVYDDTNALAVNGMHVIYMGVTAGTSAGLFRPEGGTEMIVTAASIGASSQVDGALYLAVSPYEATGSHIYFPSGVSDRFGLLTDQQPTPAVTTIHMPA